MGQPRERMSEREVCFQRLPDYVGPLRELTNYLRLSDLKVDFICLMRARCVHASGVTILFNIFTSVFRRVNVFGDRKFCTKYGQYPSQQETALEYVDSFLMILAYHVFIAVASQLVL